MTTRAKAKEPAAEPPELSTFQRRVLRAMPLYPAKDRKRWSDCHSVARVVYADTRGRLSNGCRTATTVALHDLAQLGLVEQTLVPTFSAFESGFRWALNAKGRAEMKQREEALADGLLMIGYDHADAERAIAEWDEEEREAAFRWLWREMLRASDHTDLRRLPMPDHVKDLKPVDGYHDPKQTKGVGR